MTAPVVVKSAIIPWTASYPLALSGTFDTTGSPNCVLVFFFTATGGSWGTPPTCTLGGVSGTLISTGYASNSSAGTVFVWSFPTPSSSSTLALAINQSTTYANSGCAYIVSLSGVGTTAIGAIANSITATPTTTASLVTTGANSLIIGLGSSCQAPACTVTGSPTPTLIIANTTATANFGSLVRQTDSGTGATVSVTGTAAYNYTGAAVIEVLGASGGSPVSITSGPLPGLSVLLGSETAVVTPAPPTITASALAISTALHTGTVTAPVAITSGALSITPAILSGTVLAPVSITSGPLNLSVLLGSSEAVTIPIIISAGALSLSLGVGAGYLPFPPMVAGPLSLNVSNGSGGVFVAPLITANGLSLSVGLYAGSVITPPVLTTGPLSLFPALGSVTVVEPGIIISGPLSLSPNMGSGSVITPPVLTVGPFHLNVPMLGGSVLVTQVITAGALSLSLSNGAGVVTAPLGISSGPLSVFTALKPGNVTVPAPVPVVIVAGPLDLNLSLKTGVVTDPWAIWTAPLSFNVRLGHVELPIVLVADTLILNLSRRPFPNLWGGHGPLLGVNVNILSGRLVVG